MSKHAKVLVVVGLAAAVLIYFMNRRVMLARAGGFAGSWFELAFAGVHLPRFR